MKNKRNVFLLLSSLVTVFSSYGMETRSKRKRASSSSSSSCPAPSSSSSDSALVGGESLAGAEEISQEGGGLVIFSYFYDHSKMKRIFVATCPECRVSYTSTLDSPRRLKDFLKRQHMEKKHPSIDVSNFNSRDYPRLVEMDSVWQLPRGIDKRKGGQKLVDRQRNTEGAALLLHLKGEEERAASLLLSLKGGKEEE